MRAIVFRARATPPDRRATRHWRRAMTAAAGALGALSLVAHGGDIATSEGAAKEKRACHHRGPAGGAPSPSGA
ncbi:hypothetical protein AB0I84_04315 [Streptomyces spectabilis]|uniref:hypothetical protein n=1 Tax=Streptomyces spectabilis TaxID=68270 RepID=UPI003406C66D